jgi:hypothetical protein
MIGVAVAPAAFDAIAATLPLGSVGYERQLNAKGEWQVLLESAMRPARRIAGDKQAAAEVRRRLRRRRGGYRRSQRTRFRS